ncbi:hypothetical protein PsorP6_009178 [Peronosclerospora sorghi]|uniref:Uncharacterized protein n=1 Tax=Peronosclerospora sorghi TaxID=230839 RepID=A0ACC0W0N7_9STRA|nr:hypothetical protein PsorP6_009178 [Peronosclerospora sorghi]
MKRRGCEGSYTNVVDARRKQKLHERGDDNAGENGSWRPLLKKLHFFLDNETEREVLAWSGGGFHFLVQQEGEVRLAERLGLRVCSLRQALEALNFDCQEENQCQYTMYRHDSFVRGRSDMIERILVGHNVPLFSIERNVVRPNVTYSSALKPLEVRLSLPDTNYKSWEVTIAPSVLAHPTLDTKEVVSLHETLGGDSNAETSWEDIFDEPGQWSDHDIHSPLFWSQRSDFSSICTDDLSERDALSQISAFYG